MICMNKVFSTSRNIAAKEAGKIAVNACVVIEGKSEPVENGTFLCAFVLPNFSMWDKQLNKSVGDLQCKNHKP